MTALKLMVFELDGATWNVMDSLLKRGELPNIKKIIDRGVHGVLMSESPTISPRIWTTIFSGKSPDKHGIDFFGANTNMLRTKRIWNILQDRGHKIGTFGTLVTWPPSSVNGFMIPSICALGTETFPACYDFFQKVSLSERKKWKNTTGPVLAFKDTLNLAFRLLRHGITVSTFLKSVFYLLKERFSQFGPLDQYYRKAFLHLNLSTDFLTYLIKFHQPEFCTWHIHTCDTVAHRYWAFYEPDIFGNAVKPELIRRYREVIPNSYRESDKAIGNLLPLLPHDVNIVLLSDHGGRALREAINPYTLNLDNFLDIIGITDKVVPAVFGPGVYLKFNNKSNGLIEKIASNLSEAYLEQTGDKIFFIKSLGDVLVLSKPNWRIRVEDITDDSIISLGEFGSFKVSDLFTKRDMQISGAHDDEGIIVMAGPHIRKQHKMTQTSIYDITPTLLTILGLPVARDMDGEVIEQAFEPHYLERLRQNKDHWVDTYENDIYEPIDDVDTDNTKVKERLKHLGYL